MRVRAVHSSADGCPEAVAPFLAASIPVSVSKEYDVHGLTTFGDVTLLQIVDDLRYPSWQPAWLFSVVDSGIPSDWICNVFDSGSVMLGPEFVAKDEESYTDMVELAADQVDRFWKRIESLSLERSSPLD